MSYSHEELNFNVIQSKPLIKMQSAMEEEFIFYSDDEDEKVFYTNIAPKSPIKFSHCPSLPPQKIHQQSHSRNLSSAPLILNTETSVDSKLDWSVSNNSSLLNYTNYFDTSPANANTIAPKLTNNTYMTAKPTNTTYMAPKPTNVNYVHQKSANTNYAAPKLDHSSMTSSTKNNIYQTNPIQKQISNLINETKSTRIFNPSPLNSLIERSSDNPNLLNLIEKSCFNPSPLNNLIEKSCLSRRAYQNLILDHHRNQNPDHTPSLNYSSDSFSSKFSRAEAQNLDSKALDNLLTKAKLPYNPSDYSDSFSNYSSRKEPQNVDSNSLSNLISKANLPNIPVLNSNLQPFDNNKLASKDPWPLKAETISNQATQPLTRTSSWPLAGTSPNQSTQPLTRTPSWPLAETTSTQPLTRTSSWPLAETTSTQSVTRTPSWSLAETSPNQASQSLTRTTSWSQIASKPATPLPTPRIASPKLAPSPPPTSSPTPLGPPEYHRGPKVDPRWPVEQQLFLGPIPVVVTWEEIRAAFYNKMNRQHVVHTYVQSKPVNEVVYGMIVFDKAATATKILKEGPIAVRGYRISVSPMCQAKKK